MPASAAALQAALSVAGAVLPAWHVMRHTDCANGSATILWDVSFQTCLAKASAAAGGFMYTNERWHGGAGCAVGLPPCTSPHTTGSYGNWDSYYCGAAVGGHCATPADALALARQGSLRRVSKDSSRHILRSSLG